MGALSELVGNVLSTGQRERAAGRQLAGKFTSLGAMTGKTKEEIIAVVGPPNSVSAGIGYQLLHWSRKSYYIGIYVDPNTGRFMSNAFDSAIVRDEGQNTHPLPGSQSSNSERSRA